MQSWTLEEREREVLSARGGITHRLSGLHRFEALRLKVTRSKPHPAETGRIDHNDGLSTPSHFAAFLRLPRKLLGLDFLRGLCCLLLCLLFCLRHLAVALYSLQKVQPHLKHGCLDTRGADGGETSNLVPKHGGAGWGRQVLADLHLAVFVQLLSPHLLPVFLPLLLPRQYAFSNQPESLDLLRVFLLPELICTQPLGNGGILLGSKDTQQKPACSAVNHY